MPSIKQSKSLAKTLRQALAGQGTKISHSACLEIVARQFGYADWNTMHAAHAEEWTMVSTLFVEHGREEEACSFYEAAFNAVPLRTLEVNGAVAGVDLAIGDHVFSVCGANPNRDRQPERGGPFFPKAPGAVNAVFRIETRNIAAVIKQAVAAGATTRDKIQLTGKGQKVGSLFDPFGHIWMFQQS